MKNTMRPRDIWYGLLPQGFKLDSVNGTCMIDQKWVNGTDQQRIGSMMVSWLPTLDLREHPVPLQRLAAEAHITIADVLTCLYAVGFSYYDYEAHFNARKT